MTRQAESPTFRADVEGLRGIAVLLVVLFHCGAVGFSGGFVGVDIFFVLSGYLITGLLVKEFDRTSRISLFQFYARRARRLLPASALTLAVTLGVGALILAPHEIRDAGRAARGAAIYASNIFFGLNAADYFAGEVKNNPLLHTWSLAVEEQFYFFWPLLIMAGLRGAGSKTRLVWILAVCSAISFAICLWATANTDTFAFYQIPARAWEFGLGGLASMLPVARFSMSVKTWRGVMYLSLLAILLTGWLTPEGPRFPGWLAMLPVLSTCSALIAGAALARDDRPGFLCRGPLQTLGSLSYSWYLWHWPFLVFAVALFPIIEVPGKLVSVVLALGFAALCHAWIENPIRFHSALSASPARSLGMAAAVTVLSLVIATGAVSYAGGLANSPRMQRIAAVTGGDISRIPRQRCLSPNGSPIVVTCDFGDTLSATQVVLFGDSHAMQWFNPLEILALQHGWKLTTAVKSGCPAVDVDLPNRASRVVADCNAWRSATIDSISTLRPALVIAGSSAGYLEITGKELRGSGLSLNEWSAGSARALVALSSASQRVAWLRDTPLPRHDIPTCLARSIRHSWYPGRQCEMERSKVLIPAIFEAERSGVSGLPRVIFVDMTDQLCGAEICPAMREGRPMYHDDSHLTGAFAESLAAVLGERLGLAAAGGN